MVCFQRELLTLQSIWRELTNEEIPPAPDSDEWCQWLQLELTKELDDILVFEQLDDLHFRFVPINSRNATTGGP